MYIATFGSAICVCGLVRSSSMLLVPDERVTPRTVMSEELFAAEIWMTFSNPLPRTLKSTLFEAAALNPTRIPSCDELPLREMSSKLLLDESIYTAGVVSDPLMLHVSP